MLAWKEKLERFWMGISTMFKLRHRGRIEPEQSDPKEMRILTRIVSWKETNNTHEADQEHVEVFLEELEIGDHSREVSTPVDKSAKDLEIEVD